MRASANGEVRAEKSQPDHEQAPECRTADERDVQHTTPNRVQEQHGCHRQQRRHDDDSHDVIDEAEHAFEFLDGASHVSVPARGEIACCARPAQFS